MPEGDLPLHEILRMQSRGPRLCALCEDAMTEEEPCAGCQQQARQKDGRTYFTPCVDPNPFLDL